MEMEILRGYMKIHREVQRKAQGERRIAQGGRGRRKAEGVQRNTQGMMEKLIVREQSRAQINTSLAALRALTNHL